VVEKEEHADDRPRPLEGGRHEGPRSFGRSGQNPSHRPGARRRLGGRFWCRLLCRVDFQVTGAQREYVRVEEGRYEGGVFRPVRIWNGDETDWGLNFSSAPQVLQVTLGTY
jgi:hypothetical protein